MGRCPRKLELAERLRRESPKRTAAHICEILRSVCGWSPDQRTIQRHLARRGLSRKLLSATAVAYGRFEASRANELWVGDALHGPVVARRKVVLFAFLDDHSRVFTGHRWAYREDTPRLEPALRSGMEARGLPEAIYQAFRKQVFSGASARLCAARLGDVADEQVRQEPDEREGQEPSDAHEPPPSVAHVIVAIPHPRWYESHHHSPRRSAGRSRTASHAGLLAR